MMMMMMINGFTKWINILMISKSWKKKKDKFISIHTQLNFISYMEMKYKKKKFDYNIPFSFYNLFLLFS